MLKYSSLTTKDFQHSDFCFGAEVLTVRQAIDEQYDLPEYFWRKDVDCPDKYKKAYNDNIQCVRKMMKMAPSHFVIQCLIYSKTIKHGNYGYITATVKARWEKWNERVSNRVNGMLREQIKGADVVRELEMFSEDIEEKPFDVSSIAQPKKKRVTF